MTITLPAPMVASFSADNAGDPADTVQCFAEDVVVHDERQTCTGITAITHRFHIHNGETWSKSG